MTVRGARLAAAAAAVLLLDLAGRVGAADACSFAALDEHVLDPTEVGVDEAAPAVPALVELEVRRGTGGDGCSATSCDDIGLVVVTLAPGADDRTSADELGYELSLVGGALPAGLQLPAAPVRARADGTIDLVWIDGASDDQEALMFVLAVTPVDLAGNRGATLAIAISDGGSGCSVTGRGGAGWLAAVVVLALVRRRH